MVVLIEIEGTDRTEGIVMESIRHESAINNLADTLKFLMIKGAGWAYEPDINDEIELKIDGTTTFKGVIVDIEKNIEANGLVNLSVNCLDYSQYLNRKLVTERYEGMAVNAIIADLLTNYAATFTDNNVSCDIEIETVAFNRINLSECLNKLADLTGYSWYVDNNKDIHFFSKNSEPASFNITDGNGNYVQNTLIVKNDLTQIRNSIFVEGGEEVGVERTETYEADGDQITFPLANKFSAKPVVEVNGSTISVGLDFLDAEAAFDAFWNFSGKYIRFKDLTKPGAGDIVEIIGTPLFAILVKVFDAMSIGSFGEYEFSIIDKSIKSRDEAIERALTEIVAYKNGLIEGRFDTYVAGLRSGQVINVNSTLLSTNEDFLIQRVNFTMQAEDRGTWQVELASLRTLGIIEFLQGLLRKKEISEGELESLLNYFQFPDNFTITDVINSITTTSPPYEWAPGVNEGVWNESTWS